MSAPLPFIHCRLLPQNLSPACGTVPRGGLWKDTPCRPALPTVQSPALCGTVPHGTKGTKHPMAFEARRSRSIGSEKLGKKKGRLSAPLVWMAAVVPYHTQNLLRHHLSNEVLDSFLFFPAKNRQLVGNGILGFCDEQLVLPNRHGARHRLRHSPTNQDRVGTR